MDTLFLRLAWGLLLVLVVGSGLARADVQVVSISYSSAYGGSSGMGPCAAFYLGDPMGFKNHYAGTVDELVATLDGVAVPECDDGTGFTWKKYGSVGIGQPITMDVRQYRNSDGAYNITRRLQFAYSTLADCPSGQVRDPATGQCVVDCHAKKGTSHGTMNDWAVLDVTSVPNGQTTFCADSCQVTGQHVECESASTVDGSGDKVALGTTCRVQGPFSYTGQGCSGTGSANPQLVGIENNEPPWWQAGNDSKHCAETGGYWGQVNGVDTCVGHDVGITKDTSSTGSGTTTTTDNGDGTHTSTNSTSTTTCTEGSCTTTTTTTTTVINGDGTTQSTDTKSTDTTQSQTDYCKDHTSDSACTGTKKDGQWGGDCTSGFVCTGDAVQCATAQAVWQANCANRPSNGSTLAEQIAAGNDPEQANMPWAPGKGDSIDLGGKLDTTEHFGASCPPDIAFSIQGHAVNVPLAKACDWLRWIGDIMFAGALVLAAAIAMGRPQ